MYCLTDINSQFSPLQPRYSIPGGAVGLPIQYRNERLVSPSNGGFLRARRPVLATPVRINTLQPFQNPNSLNDDAKPVTEENESGEAPTYIVQQQQNHQQQQQQQYIPQIQTFQQQQQPQSLQPQLPAVLYTTNENGEVLEQNRPLIEFSTTPRFIQQTEILPTTLRTTGSAQRFFVNQDRPIQSALQGTTKPPVSFVRKQDSIFSQSIEI